MASKPGMRVSPEKQRKPIGSQASEGNFGKPLPVQMTKTSKSEPVTPRKIPKRSQQVVSKQVHVATTKDEKSLNSCKAVYVNSLADKVDSSLSFCDLKDVSIYVGPAVRETNGSQESGGEPEKKVSENGVGTASAKVSDGASSLAKTSGSAKISDRADFVESGKSSMCRGSTSSDVSDESTCSSFSSSVNKPHKANDARWEAIQAVRAKDDLLGVGHFGLLRKLGRVKWNKMLFCYESNGQSIFVKRKKLLRAQTERNTTVVGPPLPSNLVYTFQD